MSTPLFFKPAASTYEVRLVENRPVKKRSNLSRGLLRVKNWAKKGLMALVVMVFVLLGSLAIPSVAQANPVTDGFKDLFCSTAVIGADPKSTMGAIAPDTLGELDVSKNKITIAEKYQGTAPSWTVWIGAEKQEQLDRDGEFAGKQIVQWADNDNINSWADGTKPAENPGFFNETGECGAPMEAGSTYVANMIADFTALISNFTSSVFQLTYETSDSIVAKLDPLVLNITEGMKKHLYMEFTIPLIMLSAIWLGYKGLVKKQSIEMATGALWMIAASVLGLAWLANPMFVPSVVNKSVSVVAEKAMMPFLSFATANGAGGNLCTVDAVEIKGTNATSREMVREIRCARYYAHSIEPWTMGQFGSTMTADPETDTTGAASIKGGNNGIGPDVRPGWDSTPVTLGNVAADKPSVALTQLDNTIKYAGSNEHDQKQTYTQIAANQAYGPNYNAHWIGTNGSERIMIATTALMLTIADAVITVAFCFPILTAKFALLILSLLAVVFITIAVHPGFGRRAAMQYLELIASLTIKIMVSTVLLGVAMIVVLQIIALDISLFVKLIILLAVVSALLSSKNAVLAMVKVGKGGGAAGLVMNSMGKGMLAPFQQGGNMAAGGTGAATAAIRAQMQAKKADKVHASTSDGAGSRKNQSHSPADNDSSNTASPENTDAGNGAGDSKNAPLYDVPSSDSSPSEESEAPDTAGAGARPTKAPETQAPIVDESVAPSDTAGAGPRPQGLPDLPSYEPITRASVKVHTKAKRPSIARAALAGAYAARNAGSVSQAFAAGAGAGRSKAQEGISWNVKRNTQIEAIEKQADADYRERVKKQAMEKAKRERLAERAKQLKERAELKKQAEAVKAAEKAQREAGKNGGKPNVPPRPTGPTGSDGSGAGGRSK